MKYSNTEKSQNSSRGISPVIGVILLVAITVGLAALVGFVVFGIGSDTSESADISVDTELNESGGQLDVTVLRNGNVEDLTSSVGSLDIVSDVGDVGSGSVDVSGSGGDTVTITAVVEGGDNEEVVATVDVPSSVGSP